MIKVEQKITGWNVAENSQNEELPLPEVKEIFDTMNEKINRPEVLIGTTYKIKSPDAEHSLYLTINDIVLNEDTEYESRHPYEMFINSKSMQHYQWVIALTRVISACFRKGGDLAFLNDELISVYDPNGGYYKKGGQWMPSLVAEIGHVIKKHMKSIGLINEPSITSEVKEMIKEKMDKVEIDKEVSSFPPEATVCGQCHEKSVVLLDGCSTCLNCGHGKCL